MKIKPNNNEIDVLIQHHRSLIKVYTRLYETNLKIGTDEAKKRAESYAETVLESEQRIKDWKNEITIDSST